jgi:excinuclease ABC subunit C
MTNQTNKGILPSGQVKFLLQRIRDEAHRFAIKNNRQARLKTAQKSELDKIPGIGPKIKQKILISFGSSANFFENLITNPRLVEEKIGRQLAQKVNSWIEKNPIKG